jgi:hypothetical protein
MPYYALLYKVKNLDLDLHYSGSFTAINEIFNIHNTK